MSYPYVCIQPSDSDRVRKQSADRVMGQRRRPKYWILVRFGQVWPVVLAGQFCHYIVLFCHNAFDNDAICLLHTSSKSNMFVNHLRQLLGYESYYFNLGVGQGTLRVPLNRPNVRLISPTRPALSHYPSGYKLRQLDSIYYLRRVFLTTQISINIPSLGLVQSLL